MYTQNRQRSDFGPTHRERPASEQPLQGLSPELNPTTGALYSVQWVRSSVSQLKFLLSRRSVDADMAPVIEFAIHRAPFGGASSGDLFVAFGTGRRRFMEMFHEGLQPRRGDNQDVRWLKRRLLEALTAAWRVEGVA